MFKKTMVISLVLASFTAVAHTAQPGTLGGIAANGFDQDQARTYCEENNGELPSAKQIALALNPEGVSDTPVEGWHKIQAGKDTFYYNRATYVRHEYDINIRYWTATQYIPDSNGSSDGDNAPGEIPAAYVFSAWWGDFYVTNPVVFDYDRTDLHAPKYKFNPASFISARCLKH